MLLKKYQVLAFKDADTLLISKLNKVYTFNIESNEINEIFRFKSDLFTVLSSYSSVLRRLFRKDFRLGLKINNENLLLVKDKCIYRLDLESNRLVGKVSPERGTRPLNITKVESLNGFDDGVYFGEYFTNPLKSSVKIYKYGYDNQLKVVYEFSAGLMNHIHNLVVDKYRDCIWVLAGDTDDGAAIFQIKDNFKSVERIVFGKQKYRSCVLFPLEDGLLYATDSQYEGNSIRFLTKKRDKWESLHLSDINGPCIYGTKIKNNFYFSTAVEGLNSGNIFQQLVRNQRGPGVKRNQSEIICGNKEIGFKTIYSNKKDILPYFLFQFGNIFFPTGENLSKKLFFTVIALKNNDFSTEILENEI